MEKLGPMSLRPWLSWQSVGLRSFDGYSYIYLQAWRVQLNRLIKQIN
jgi:hypothetical protein